MNTTTAAATASVTVATIRSWCRNGVITATKGAGRWIIDAASLAHRITLAALKTRKAKAMDLNAAYTYTPAGSAEPVTITPDIQTRQRGGMTITSIHHLAPLLANHIDAITDEGNRLHTLTALSTAYVYLRSVSDEDTETGRDSASSWRESGRLATSYCGTPDLPVDTVLDLAAAIRTAL